MAGIDAAFLYMETPSMHLHVVGVLVLDPSGAPGGFPLEKLSEVLGDPAPIAARRHPRAAPRSTESD